MLVLYSPQFNDQNELIYQFENDKIIVTYTDENKIKHTDQFDFSQLPDGIAQSIETTLPIDPIIKAERINGNLYLTLLRFHDDQAGPDELFPNWVVI